jgi:NADH:ubiquinone oxidoreductase subunit 4 (chain M)
MATTRKNTKNRKTTEKTRSVKMVSPRNANSGKKSKIGTASKKKLSKSKVKRGIFLNLVFLIGGFFKKIFSAIASRVGDFKGRRPHRSFRSTRRRDYDRSLKMPGYIAFTRYVFSVIWQNKKTFIALVLVLSLANILLVGMMSQDMYSSLSGALDEANEEIAGGSFGQLGKAALLLLSTATTGGLNTSPTEVQYVFGALIVIIMWLVTVWILRNRLAGKKIKMRDGLYNACAPLVSTVFIFLVLVIQAIPALIAFIVYSVAVATDFLTLPFYATIFWVVAGALVLISLYLIVGTMLALIVVTIPGMYPFEAIKIAGDLVIGRRLRVIMRTFWALFVLVLMWIVVMIPVFLFVEWIKPIIESVISIPIAPVALVLMSAISVVFLASYMYLFYRKIIDDGASPA